MDESELFPLHFILYVFGVYIAKINCIYHGLPACMFTANKKKKCLLWIRFPYPQLKGFYQEETGLPFPTERENSIKVNNEEPFILTSH